MLEINKIYNEDCLGDNGMCLVDDGCVDLILADLPYGTTKCKWDSILPMDKLWEQYKRVIKPDGVIVLTASQPFTSLLVNSCISMFKFEDVWDKRMPTGHLNAKKMPLRQHESVLVFSKTSLGKCTYNPQMRKGKMVTKGAPGKNHAGPYDPHDKREAYRSDLYYPTSIINVGKEAQGSKVHPTQKPVSLFEYLIKTYSNEGELVLDNVIGSGTTAIACINTKRNFIGFENDEKYFNLANQRLQALWQ